MVGISSTNGKRAMSVVAQTTGHPQSSTQTRAATPVNQDELRSFSLIRQALQCHRVLPEAQDVIIGLKHGFPCINICQVPREMLKTEAEGCYIFSIVVEFMQ